MIQQVVKNVEIDTEGKADCFMFYVKIPHPIHKKYADRVIDEFEKVVTDFVRIIERPEFWI